MNKEEVLQEAEKQLAQLKAQVLETKGAFNEGTAAANRLQNILLHDEGKHTKDLHKSLKDLGVDLGAYIGGCFIGNHAMKLISGNGPETITSAFADHPVLSEKFQTYLKSLGGIYALISKASFLSDQEIQMLTQLCGEFRRFLIKTFPGKGLTTKMHLLTDHVPEFATRHKTVGLQSEQPLETLHKNLNELHRRFCCVRNEYFPCELIISEHHISSAAALSALHKT